MTEPSNKRMRKAESSFRLGSMFNMGAMGKALPSFQAAGALDAQSSFGAEHVSDYQSSDESFPMASPVFQAHEEEEIIPNVDDDDTSFLSLHAWFKHVFEHYGWMLLAKARHDDAKVSVFLQGVDKLVDHIAKKYRDTLSEDRRDDLAILYKHANILKTEAHARFNPAAV